MKKNRLIEPLNICFALASFSFSLAINKICELIFKANSFGMEEAPPIAESIVNFLLTLILFLIFHSVHFTLAVNDGRAKREFLAAREQSAGLSAVAYVFKNPRIYIEIALLAILSAVLPLSFTYAPVSELLFGGVGSAALKKLFTLLVALPLLFLLIAFAHVAARKEFLREAEKKESAPELAGLIKALVVVVIVFISASVIVPWFVPSIVTLWNLCGGMLLLWLPLIIIAVVGAIVAYSYIRAILKYKKFIKSLRKLCSDGGRSLSDLPKAGAAVSKISDGIDFSVRSKSATYDCKMVAGVFRNSLMVFSDRGNGLRQITFRIFRAELFHIMTKMEYGFESQNKKVIIILPAPRNIYASVAGSPPRPADNGERVGEYTLYSASGFINMLDREI